MPKQTPSILTVHIAQETDFLLARQRAKQIAALLHFDVQDQTRIATAVSEIARNTFEYAGSGKVEFFLDTTPSEIQMRIVVSDHGPGIPHLESIWNGTYQSPQGMGIGLIGARRLMDALDVETSPAGTSVTLLKRLPRGVTPPSLADLSTVLTRSPVAHSSVLLDQNQELLRLLKENRARESELRVLNEELAETNRGVLVLYAELEDKARAVQQASETKTRFLSGVTHELRTPLNSIVSLARLMLSHSDGPLTAEQEKQAHFILRSAQNLTEMVNDLLDLARLEAGKAQTTLTRFTVAELYAGLRGMFRPLASNPAVQLIFEIPAQPLPLHTDEGKLAQILRNFISNALKFTESGTVRVTASPNPGHSNHITFSVADTGVGIAPEDHELVMQEWGQVTNATATRHKGSGLGLPLSKSLAELLGGHVHFTSTPGHGSTFHLTLPALDPQPPSHAPSPSLPGPAQQPAPALSQPPPTILIADSDDIARYLLRRTLSLFTTSSIQETSSTAQTLTAIHQQKPALLFLALDLPNSDLPNSDLPNPDLPNPDLSNPEASLDLPTPGPLDLVRQLREAPATQDLPILLGISRALTPPEREAIERYDLTPITRRTDRSSTTSPDESATQIERALLQVGLSNMHQDPAR